MVGENHRTIFASASFLGRAVNRKNQSVLVMVGSSAMRRWLPTPLDYAALAAAVKGRDERKGRALDSSGKGTGVVSSLSYLTPPSLS